MAVPFAAKWYSPCLVLAAICVLSAGCDRSARSLSLDEARAREVCTRFLEAWRDGRQPADLKPEITGRDHQWLSGKKLVSFELLPEETSDGTNLHIPVQLTLEAGDGKEVTSTALYVVGTSPVVTVFRD